MTSRWMVQPFQVHHASGVADICRALGWSTYADEEVARRGCSAAGVTTLIAVDRSTVVGFCQAMSDGIAQGYVAQHGVMAEYRRQGVARALIAAAFEATGVSRLDLITDDAQTVLTGPVAALTIITLHNRKVANQSARHNASAQ